MNEHFKETHPGIDATVTLSQIRSLKSKLLQVAQAQNLELSSVCFAYVYFEKLVLKNFVKKVNRKLVGAVCLLLAAKINDPKELDYVKLLEALEKILDVTRKEVYANEFQVYSALDFTLFLPLDEISPHMNRILSDADNPEIEDYFATSEFYLNRKSSIV